MWGLLWFELTKLLQDLERETGSDNNGVYGVNTQLRNNGDFNTFAVSRFEGISSLSLSLSTGSH